MEYSLCYQEWSEADRRVVRLVDQATVSREELFIRKLVNATLIRNQLYVHSSNESENFELHHIYVAPFDARNQPYGEAIREAAFEYCSVSARIEAEWKVYDGSYFVNTELIAPDDGLIDIARMLLDHYLIIEGHTYETIYSLLDNDRNKVVFYVREVDI
ncbi:hypothetical protein [Paenibacillus alkalitolerans]|uniref:hypothetical protein n=1 Tax=Paenibacillus alkalitolerans TaxID=2799335 RepID=UPI0018F31CEC|nr:hypothetical protein [Paenibacillus alkalitolerans]